jgi:hypothetical protein
MGGFKTLLNGTSVTQIKLQKTLSKQSGQEHLALLFTDISTRCLAGCDFSSIGNVHKEHNVNN